MYSIAIFKRNTTQSDEGFRYGLTYQVKSYSRDVYKGPDKAVVYAYGERGDLYRLFSKLGEWLYVYIEGDPDPVYFGQISKVTVSDGIWDVSASLDNMANKIAVAFSLLRPGFETAGDRQTTTWASDTQSQAIFGIKEALVTINDATLEQAETLRDTLLETIIRLSPGVQYTGRKDSGLSATIECTSVFDTLDWLYYSQDAGKEYYEDVGDGVQYFGDLTASTRIAQSFRLSSATAWNAYSAWVKIRKLGTPTDNVICEIYSDSSGSPGTLLGSATYDGSLLTESYQWVEFVFSSQFALSLLTTYWLVFRRAGSNNSSNYYGVDLSESLGYTNGVFRIYNGSSWVARSPDADMNFRVTGVLETTEQIRLIAETVGQFLNGVDILTSSGVSSSQYRNGDKTGGVEILDLMMTGQSDGKRIFADVTPERRLVVYAETLPGVADYVFKSDGTLIDKENTTVDLRRCPCGFWGRPEGLDEETDDLYFDSTLIFVERAEYDADAQIWRPESGRSDSPWNVNEIVPG